jgi:hypothetical protein
MNEQAYLEYVFMFTPSTKTWTNLFQFEGDLTKFFTDHNIDVTVIKTVDGQNGRRILLLAGREEVLNQPMEKKEKPRSIGDKIKSLAPERKMSAAEKAFRNRKK